MPPAAIASAGPKEAATAAAALLPQAGPWARFHQAHLFDYNPAATRYWLALSLAGLAAAAGACALLLADTTMPLLLQVLGWLGLVALAAAFPLEIPRTRLSIAPGDLLIFLLLAQFGSAPAVLGAALEGLVASQRATQRLSSRVATPAANAAAMALASFAHLLIRSALVAQGLPGPAAELMALAAAAMVYFASSSMALTLVICLKKQLPLSLGDWLADNAWVGAVYLGSALLAGLLALNAQWFGPWVMVAVVVTLVLAVSMMRMHFAHQNREHEVQEARLVAAEQEALQNQRRFHSAFTHASIGMAIVTPECSILQANQALASLLGRAEGSLPGSSFTSHLHPGDAGLLLRQIDTLLARKAESFSIELRCRGYGATGETWVSLHCAPFDDQAGAGAGLILQLYDISSRRRAEGELQHIAYHDVLTDLANRACFQERLQQAVERSRAEPQDGFAVMYLDLDRFKLVNDSLGHPAGDALLKEAGQRLTACVRPQDLVARLGGDEFAILVEDSMSDAGAVVLGERLLDKLRQPLCINGTELQAQASLGITFSDGGLRGPEEVLRDADLAMYKAKADGKGRLALFDASLHEQISHKLQLEADLRNAIGEGQLTLAFQPLYELSPYKLNGFEALARWTHPTRGAISPSVFIALAEETGCIEALTAWAIEEAVRQLAAWRRELPGTAELVMHVNVSGKDLARPHFVPHVREVLQRHKLPGHLLVLEITESTLMEHREQALQALARLRELGVKLGIDDFGTGYSSLAYLSTLPFDCLKIDRSFVIGMDLSPQNMEIVRTVVSLGRSLNKHVVAEGIETHEQLLRLIALGATIGQGYLLAKPLMPAQVRDLLRVPEAVSEAVLV